MKSIAIVDSRPVTDRDCFVSVQLEHPQPGPRDLVVRVDAVSVNPVDGKIRRSYEPRSENGTPVPRVLGYDAAGTVEAIGSEVELFSLGRQVWCAGDITRHGSNAEYLVVDERICAPRPALLSAEDAAGMPLVTITAWEALFDRMGLASPSDGMHGLRDATVLVLGGGGGVASMAIQLARLGGHHVIAATGRQESADWCRSLGAHEVISHRDPLRPQLERAGAAGVDAVLICTRLEDYLPQMADVLSPQARVCSIIGREDGEPVDVSALRSKSISFSWELMFTRPMFATADMIAQHKLLLATSRLVDSGAIHPITSEHLGPMSVDTLRRAHELIESGTTIGKIVLGPLSRS